MTAKERIEEPKPDFVVSSMWMFWFFLIAVCLVVNPGLVDMVNESQSEKFPPVFRLTVYVFAAGTVILQIVAFTRAPFGRWKILKNGIEFKGIWGTTKRLGWVDVERIKWHRTGAILQGKGVKLFVLLGRRRPEVRQFVKDRLDSAFDLTEAPEMDVKRLKFWIWTEMIILLPIYLGLCYVCSHDAHSNARYLCLLLFYSALILVVLMGTHFHASWSYRRKNRELLGWRTRISP